MSTHRYGRLVVLLIDFFLSLSPSFSKTSYRLFPFANFFSPCMKYVLSRRLAVSVSILKRLWKRFSAHIWISRMFFPFRVWTDTQEMILNFDCIIVAIEILIENRSVAKLTRNKAKFMIARTTRRDAISCYWHRNKTVDIEIERRCARARAHTHSTLKHTWPIELGWYRKRLLL